MGYVQEARENHVKKKVEEALRSKMKQKALKECDHYTSKYAQCASGKTISIIWKCRKQAQELNSCLHQLKTKLRQRTKSFVEERIEKNNRFLFCELEGSAGTNDAVLEEMKREYMLQEDGKGTAKV